MTRSDFLFRLLPLAAALLTASAQAASFTVPAGTTDTTAKTLGSGSGQTGTVAATGKLQVSGSTVAVTITGNNETLTNNGTILQTGTGRAIRDNTGVTGLVVTNNANAVIQTADADVFQMNVAASSATLNNYGTMTSLNASGGGSQAVDFSAITNGANIINNYAGGILQAVEADAVRPGVNGIVYNDGLIKSTTTTGSSSDGVDAQNNTGVQVTNDTLGIIEGGRHGITGGALNNATPFTTTITNNAGGVIQGDNGSGINLDGFNALQTATIINHGTITGNGVTGDGDGVDVDGVVNLTNSGTIISKNSVSSTTPAQSEGVTVGGGTIINTGTIEGDVAAGNTNAVGRGITLAGIDTSGTPEAIYANSVITNSGLIKGQTDSAIVVTGATGGFTVNINNMAGGTIEGGSATAATIITGAEDDTVTNSGAIVTDHSGKAIDLGGGTNILNITGGAASISGDISGGTGTSTLNLALGSGGTFSYSGAISNFAAVNFVSGRTVLTGASTYSGGSTIEAGATLVANNISGSATGSGLVTVQNLGTLAGSGRIGGDVSVTNGGLISPGNSPGTLTIGGSLQLVNGAKFSFDLGPNAANSDLVVVTGKLIFTGSGSAVFNFVNDGMVAGLYTLLTFDSSSTGLSVSDFSVGTWDPSFAENFVLSSNSLSFNIVAVPEPSYTAAALGSLVFAGVARWRRRLRGPAAA